LGAACRPRGAVAMVDVVVMKGAKVAG
jgi:hypothetical protein